MPSIITENSEEEDKAASGKKVEQQAKDTTATVKLNPIEKRRARLAEKQSRKDARLARKVEKPENQMVYMYTFIVTNMDLSPEYLIKFYCKRGLMENFIKESKTGFDFASVSSHTRVVNANRLQIHALAYNIFNWFRRLALSADMRKQRIDTVRLKLLKIAAKVIHSARYITFKLCSSCPYKNEFYETLSNISRLNVQLE